MARDESLNERLRNATEGLAGLSEKNMMGGTCFLLNGHMICGAHREKTGEPKLMFRLGTDNDHLAESLPHAEPMIQGGRRMRGFYFTDADAMSDADIRRWISPAIAHAMSLPPKDEK